MALTYTEAQIQAKLDSISSIADDVETNANDIDTLETTVGEHTTTLGTLSTTVNAIPHIYSSTSEPTSSDGNNGDIWIVLES